MVGSVFSGFEWQKLLRRFYSHFDEQQRVLILGHSDTGAGTDVILRYLGARATQFVRVHVQHDGGGAGGATYDDTNYVSSTRVDLRESRQQDVTISRNGTDDYFVWLIPEQLNTDGSYTLFDGGDGPDQMAFKSLGA